jgi:DNA (cytosine-5)-methyltransferase 1
MNPRLEGKLVQQSGHPAELHDVSHLSRPVAVDLFCGAGGLSSGLERAGFDVALGLDFNRHVVDTYRANHGGVMVHADVRDVNGADLLAEAGVSHVDLLAGGPSCQGFSTHGKRLADDDRNFLYQEFMRLVADIRPATVLMENVKGLLIARKGAYRDEVVASFGALGYQVTGQVLLAADYGVPQLRERVFFAASRLGGDLTLPVPTHGRPTVLPVQAGQLRPYVTLGEAIGDLPQIGDFSRADPLPYSAPPACEYQQSRRQGSSEVYNHVSRPLSDLARSVIEQLGPGQGLRAIPPERLPARFHRMRRISTGELRRDCTTLYHRLSPDRPSYTITCNFTNVSAGAFAHPHELRAITAREAARLQSFPDTFRFLGSAVPHQIGNAVPPLLGEAVGRSMLDHLARRGVAVA